MNSKAKHKSNININNYNKEKGKKKDKKSTDSIEQFFNENPSQNSPSNLTNSNQKKPFIYYNQLSVNPPEYTDSNNSEDEGMEDYKIGGYHPVHIGEILLNRYIITQKLGWGHFSTAWLAKDTKFDTYVAIKIQKSSQNYLDAAYDEVEILQELEKHYFDQEWVDSVKEYWKDSPEKAKEKIDREHSHIVQLLNSFIHHGPNGRHFCMVFEIMGVTLLELIKRFNYKGIPIPYVRVIAKQILIGLDYLHRICGVIHTDMKPENVLVCLTKGELEEIYHKGVFDSNKRNDTIKKSDSNDSERIAGKKKRKKNKKMKQAQIKKMESLGMSETDINRAIDELMEKKKIELNEENAEKEIDIENYDITDLIERPRVLSEPKQKIFNCDSNDKPIVNLSDYSQQIQKYIKEYSKIKKDKDYRKDLLVKNILLSEAESNEEKKQIAQRFKEKEQIRQTGMDASIKVKICDLGNACWIRHHFSSEIQTRQYRSPEVILGINYNHTADLWSFACMIFELVTGDFLFEPIVGPTYSKNDDHLAQIIELLGKMPKRYALSGSNSKKYFSKDGKLLRIQNLEYWPLKSVLMNKYKIKEREAKELSNFLLPMLEYYPEKRATAQTMLNHPWLKMPANFDYIMSDWEYERMRFFQSTIKRTQRINELDVVESDSELNYGDSEDNSQYSSKDIFEETDEYEDPINIHKMNTSFAAYGEANK